MYYYCLHRLFFKYPNHCSIWCVIFALLVAPKKNCKSHWLFLNKTKDFLTRLFSNKFFKINFKFVCKNVLNANLNNILIFLRMSFFFFRWKWQAFLIVLRILTKTGWSTQWKHIIFSIDVLIVFFLIIFCWLFLVWCMAAIRAECCRKLCRNWYI